MSPLPFLKSLRQKPSYGLEWTVRRLKWIRLSQVTPERYRLQFADSLELPEQKEQIAPVLRKYVQDKGLEKAQVAVSMPEHLVHIRRMELPRMPEEDLKEAIRWQMRDVAEGNIEDYVIDDTVLEEKIQGEITRLALLGIACPKKLVEEQKLFLDQCGLEAFFMEPAPVSLAFTLNRSVPTMEGEWVGCVHIGEIRSFLIALSNGKLQLVRPLAGVSGEQARPMGEAFFEKCAIEIQSAIDSFSIAFPAQKMGRLFLSGEGAGVAGLDKSLTTNVGIPTRCLNPLEGIEQAAAFPAAVSQPHLFPIALGLAMVRP